MKTLLAILLATLCAATSYGQTMKALSYNTTNGQVVAATNVVWTNAFSFSTNTVAAQVRTNLSLGSTWLTNTNVTNFRTAIGLGLPALTNTSNVTTMRALAGSTNTNEPHSGTINVFDVNEQEVQLTISNGIIVSVSYP
jgi:hypothetical protein